MWKIFLLQLAQLFFHKCFHHTWQVPTIGSIVISTFWTYHRKLHISTFSTQASGEIYLTLIAFFYFRLLCWKENLKLSNQLTWASVFLLPVWLTLEPLVVCYKVVSVFLLIKLNLKVSFCGLVMFCCIKVLFAKSSNLSFVLWEHFFNCITTKKNLALYK